VESLTVHHVGGRELFVEHFNAIDKVVPETTNSDNLSHQALMKAYLKYRRFAHGMIALDGVSFISSIAIQRGLWEVTLDSMLLASKDTDELYGRFLAFGKLDMLKLLVRELKSQLLVNDSPHSSTRDLIKNTIDNLFTDRTQIVEMITNFKISSAGKVDQAIANVYSYAGSGLDKAVLLNFTEEIWKALKDITCWYGPRKITDLEKIFPSIEKEILKFYPQGTFEATRQFYNTFGNSAIHGSIGLIELLGTIRVRLFFLKSWI